MVCRSRLCTRHLIVRNPCFPVQIVNAKRNVHRWGG
nr:MAG TPA: hypothetical protein [Caudoviricetes sp.]